MCVERGLAIGPPNMGELGNAKKQTNHVKIDGSTSTRNLHSTLSAHTADSDTIPPEGSPEMRESLRSICRCRVPRRGEVEARCMAPPEGCRGRGALCLSCLVCAGLCVCPLCEASLARGVGALAL